MQTLSYGFQLPQTGDKGPSVFPALNSNIQQINNHNHDGVNSAPISSFAIQSAQGQVLAANWASYGGPIGDYRQLVTMAAGYVFDKSTMSFRLNTGEYIYPKVIKNNDTSFYVYSNDPSINLTVVYGG